MVPPVRGCGRRLRRQLVPLVRRASATPGADRYRKHFPAEAHLWILLQHVLSASPSLRQTHGELCGEDGAWERLGLPQGISRSQLARSSTSRPVTGAETLWEASVALAHQHRPADPAWQRLIKVQAMDSTFLRLSEQVAPWSRHGQHAAGVRLQVGLDLAGQIPSALPWSLADRPDVTALAARDLAALAGWTLLLDLGYYAHRTFARLRDNAVSFVCRLHPQARFAVTASHDIDPAPTADGDVVVADETITLGSPNNRRGAVLPDLRLVTSRNPAGALQRFITDRHDLPATEVVALYRKRWQIELFCRWLKHQLALLHPFGTSPQAVWLTILIAAVVAILAMLVEPERPKGDSRIQWLRGVGRALLTSADDTS